MFAPNICKLVRKTIISKLILFDYPKSVVRACADFVYCWTYCLSCS